MSGDRQDRFAAQAARNVSPQTVDVAQSLATTRSRAGELRTEPLSTEPLRTELLSTEALSTEKPSSEHLSTEPSFAYGAGNDWCSLLGGLSERARTLVGAVPSHTYERRAWLKQIARDEEIALFLAQRLGVPVVALDVPFACVLHKDGCRATLTRGGNGEIVYHDHRLTSERREFQTLPEFYSALRSGVVRRLRGLEHLLWRLRLLYECGLLALPLVDLPLVAPGSSAPVRRARHGFELLVRSRWLFEPRTPVAYTRAFVERWCGIRKDQSRRAIYELIRQHVIEKVGDIPSGRQQPTSLYLPGRGVRP